MALTVRKIYDELIGSQSRLVLLKVDFDATYPPGGEPFDLAPLAGLRDVKAVFAEMKSGFSFEYDYVNEKLIAYVAAGTQATGDQSALVGVRVLVFGTG